MNRSAARLYVLHAAGALLRRLAPAPPAQVRSVLLIRPDHLGDVLLSRPAIDRLRERLPEARITVAVGPWGRPALGAAPGHGVLVCPFPGFTRRASGPVRPYVLLWRFARRLRHGRYDLAVTLRPDHWWGAWLAALAGIPLRVGYATPETAPFLTDAAPYREDRHAVEASLQLADLALAVAGVAAPAGDRSRPALPSVAMPADRRAVDRLLHDARLGDRAFLVLHPGSGAALKSWPTARFAALGAALSPLLPVAVVVTGSAAERPLASALCDALTPGALNLAGALKWGELEALFERARLIVGVDSGPLHLAVAAGTPSVALFGPADPSQFAPWGAPERHRVVVANLPCRPCRRLDYCRIAPGTSGAPPCMLAIEVGAVLAAARAALAAGRS